MSAMPEAAAPASISAARLVALGQKCRGLSLRAGMISAMQAGDYRAAVKGRGMEYDESRPYQAGDDIRNIDWRVTARSGKAHTKLFREERERPVQLWLDFRAPMFFATRGRFKAVIAAELACLFAWTAHRQGDRVGGIVFSETTHHELKPQRGKAAVLRLIRHMVEHPAWARAARGPGERGPLPALLALRRLARPGSLIILLSDFRGFDEEARAQLARLRRHNELIMAHIHDRLEARLPAAGYYRVTDGERELAFDSRDQRYADDYARRFSERQAALLKCARACHINYLSCRTEADPAELIRQGLCQR